MSSRIWRRMLLRDFKSLIWGYGDSPLKDRWSLLQHCRRCRMPAPLSRRSWFQRRRLPHMATPRLGHTVLLPSCCQQPSIPRRGLSPWHGLNGAAVSWPPRQLPCGIRRRRSELRVRVTMGSGGYERRWPAACGARMRVPARWRWRPRKIGGVAKLPGGRIRGAKFPFVTGLGAEERMPGTRTTTSGRRARSRSRGRRRQGEVGRQRRRGAVSRGRGEARDYGGSPMKRGDDNMWLFLVVEI
jgi:hypothetical protein